MTSKSDEFLKLVNASGFPLQVRIAEEIKGLRSHHHWKVVAQEHHWAAPDGRGGFIDLIAGFGMVRLVIECKKAADIPWLFLVPGDSDTTVTRARCLCTEAVTGGHNVNLWSDVALRPESSESAFCVVRGQAEKQVPMLERIAGELLTAVECLAAEELSLLLESDRVTERRIYLPVVATAADLQVCLYDADSVDLATGEVPEATFERVDLVRFRKGLADQASGLREPDSVEEANRLKERTVLVMRASRVAGILRDWEMEPVSGEQWPHLIARQLEAR